MDVEVRAGAERSGISERGKGMPSGIAHRQHEQPAVQGEQGSDSVEPRKFASGTRRELLAPVPPDATLTAKGCAVLSQTSRLVSYTHERRSRAWKSDRPQTQRFERIESLRRLAPLALCERE